MKTRVFLIVRSLAFAVAAAWTIAGPTPAASEDGIAVYFSPNGGCTDGGLLTADQGQALIDTTQSIIDQLSL